MARPLPRGANVALTKEVPNLKGVVLGIHWDAGADAALSGNLVSAVLLCDAQGAVLSDQHFIFFNQLTSPDLSVTQLDAAMGEDDEQVEVDLDTVPPAVHRIAVVLYINEGSTAKRTLAQLRSCRVRVLDRDTNGELTRSEELATALSNETAVVMGGSTATRQGWKFRVVGQGFADGIAGIGKTHGIRW